LGKGHGTEAVNRVLDFGFNDLNLHRIKAGCCENIASIKVLEKVGMMRGTRKTVATVEICWSDNFQYAILETDSRSSDLETKHSL
jgi:RimJ/RimL family protein N-acetyltransferase